MHKDWQTRLWDVSPQADPIGCWNSLDFCYEHAKWSHNCRNFILTHEDGPWPLHSPFHTSSSAGSEDGDQSDHSLLCSWQHWPTAFLWFPLGYGRGSMSWCLFLIVPSPAIPRQTWAQTTVFLHTQSSPARARLKDFDEKMNFLVNFHFLWGVHMRTHQCGSGGRTGSVLFGSENTIMEYLLLTLL